MTKQHKITLSASRDIPFNMLMLSHANVRHVKAGVSIEELAEDIARRALLSSIIARPVLDENGAETGMYTIIAGGWRFPALELPLTQKRMNKTALVPCIMRTGGLAEEDRLAENVQRAPLHSLDQFRAFQAMRETHRERKRKFVDRQFCPRSNRTMLLVSRSASPEKTSIGEGQERAGNGHMNQVQKTRNGRSAQVGYTRQRALD